jgi:hypothetical protein
MSILKVKKVVLKNNFSIQNHLVRLWQSLSRIYFNKLLLVVLTATVKNVRKYTSFVFVIL